MTTKWVVILTITLGAAAMVIGLALMFAIVDINSSGAKKKGAALGQIVGVVTVIPIAVVWIMWGLQMRKQNEQNPPRGKPRC